MTTIPADKRRICFKGMFLSSILINCETMTELKKMATKSEDPKTTERVIGK